MGVSRRFNITVAVALLAALVLALPMFARPDRVDVFLTRTCQVGSSSIEAGPYHLVIDTNKVSFVRNGRVVAEATGEWKKADRKADSTSVIYQEDGRITEIHVNGRDSYFAIS